MDEQKEFAKQVVDFTRILFRTAELENAVIQITDHMIGQGESK